MYNTLLGMLSPEKNGVNTWMSIWCKERWYPLQCDYSAMLSPDMFGEFVKPSLQREAQFLDKSVYHWDGPNEIPHLDHLLDIDELTAIQWTAGDGQNNVIHPEWYPLFHRIQDKGKGLVLLNANPKYLPQLMDEFSPKGVYLGFMCDAEEEADYWLGQISKWK